MATMIEFSRTGDVSSPRSLRLRYLGLAFFWACSMLTFRSAILLTGNADTPNSTHWSWSSRSSRT